MIRAFTKESPKEVESIPDYLIKEEINEKPYYYKGYRMVMSGEKTLEDIMGASGLQSLIVEILLNFLFQNVGRKNYRFFTNEIGAHIKKGTNLSFDIAVFDKKLLPFHQITEYYVNVPPKIVFEIDVKIDLQKENGISYINAKTEKLLAYGTELVIWILTKEQKLLVARPEMEWQIVKWDVDVNLINGILLNLGQLIKDEEELG